MEDEYTGYLNRNKFYKDNGVIFELDKNTVMMYILFPDSSKITFDLNVDTFGNYDITRTIMHEIIMHRLKLIKLKKIRDSING